MFKGAATIPARTRRCGHTMSPSGHLRESPAGVAMVLVDCGEENSPMWVTDDLDDVLGAVTGNKSD